MRTFILAVLFSLFFAPFSKAQCDVYVTSNYYTSDAVAYDQPSGNVYYTVTMTGSSTMGMNPSCPCSNCVTQFNSQVPYILHYPMITNTINSVDASGTTSLCAECYLSYQTTSAAQLVAGQTLTTTGKGQVNCPTYGGIFVVFPIPQMQLHLDATWMKQPVGTGQIPFGGWPMGQNCALGHSPADWWQLPGPNSPDMPDGEPNPDNWQGYAVTYRRQPCFYCSFTGATWYQIWHIDQSISYASKDIDLGKPPTTPGPCTCVDCGQP